MILKPAEVEASWYGRVRLGRLETLILNVLSKIYSVVTWVRTCLYAWGLLKQTHLPVPVLVVGNLIVGGAGKTPVVRALARQLQELGWRPGIISRGYGRKFPGVRAVGLGDCPQCVGDEPLLYAQDGFPVYVGEKRADAGRALLTANPGVNILIADDGLQHLALARDAEVVVFDQRGEGNGCLLPAGPMRESLDRLNSPLIRGVLVQGLPDQSAWPKVACYKMSIKPGMVYTLNQPTRQQTLTSFAGKSVLALAGIGNPERFFTMLREEGLQVQGLSFPDHHDFLEDDIPSTQLPVLMTEKDAVKCREFSVGHDNWFVVPISTSFSPALPLADWLRGINVGSTMENR